MRRTEFLSSELNDRGLTLQSHRRRQDGVCIDPLGGVVAGVTGGAVALRLFARAGSQQAVEREIGQRIGLDEAANLIDRVIGSD